MRRPVACLLLLLLALVGVSACLASQPVYEAVDLSRLAAPDDVGAVLIAETAPPRRWEAPGPPRNFMGGSRFKPHDTHVERGTEGLAGALIEAGHVVLDVSELRRALHRLARGIVDRPVLKTLDASARQQLDEGLARCRAFNPRAVLGDNDATLMVQVGAFSGESGGQTTCMAELAAWLWEQQVTALGAAWVVETANRSDTLYDPEPNVLGGWPSKTVQQTVARAWRPGARTMRVGRAMGHDHPAAPLRALRGIGAEVARDVPQGPPERPDKRNPALFVGHAETTTVEVRPANDGGLNDRGWRARSKGSALSVAEGCLPALRSLRVAPREAVVAKALTAMWPEQSMGQGAAITCELRAVRSRLGPDEVRYALACGDRRRGTTVHLARVSGAAPVDVTPVVRRFATRLLDGRCSQAYQEAASFARQAQRRQTREQKRRQTQGPAYEERSVRSVGGHALAETFAMTPSDVAVLDAYLVRLAVVNASSDDTEACELLERAREATRVINRHTWEVVQDHVEVALEPEMLEQVDATAEALTRALPGITVHRGEAASTDAVIDVRELSAGDLPPAFKEALADPLMFGDVRGQAPHHVFMTDSQICTDVATLHDVLPAAHRRYAQMPACLRAWVTEELGQALDTASRGCFCDDRATAQRLAPALLERLAPFDDIIRSDGRRRTEAVREALDDDKSHFDGRCDF